MAVLCDMDKTGKHDDSGDEIFTNEKKLRRREQNRKAAERFRAKRRKEEMAVIEDHKRFRSSNAAIRHDIIILKRKKEQLQKILDEHLSRDLCYLRKHQAVTTGQLSFSIPPTHNDNSERTSSCAILDNSNSFEPSQTTTTMTVTSQYVKSPAGQLSDRHGNTRQQYTVTSSTHISGRRPIPKTINKDLKSNSVNKVMIPTFVDLMDEDEH